MVMVDIPQNANGCGLQKIIAVHKLLTSWIYIYIIMYIYIIHIMYRHQVISLGCSWDDCMQLQGV